ncbi:MAG TPA: SRPBCC family protein [Solirubrobacteraceae bacterium]|nr:SRPBCC family protein [Solirubrobacteraceae bacterium]
MRVSSASKINAPVQTVWGIASDPARALSFMSGVTRWEVASDPPAGRGARYRMLMRIGSAEVGGLIEIVEWRPPFDLAWHSVTGLDQRGRFRLRSLTPGRTQAEFRLAYGVAGSGLAGWLAERVAAPGVQKHLARSMTRLGELAQQEHRRAQAEARRVRVAGR